MRRAWLIWFLIAAVSAGICAFSRSGRQSRAFTFSVELASTAAGRVQVYYDVGRGFNEADSRSLDIQPSPERRSVTLPLPEGDFHAVRFDPLSAAARITFSLPRINRPDGRAAKVLHRGDFVANDQVQDLREDDGGLSLTVPEGRDDPTLLATFSPPLVLRTTWLERLSAEKATALVAFALTFLALLALDAVWRRHVTLQRKMHERPTAALWLASAVASIAACYPVIFLGKSFVSPSNTPLLYEHAPSVPGYTEPHAARLPVGDLAAMMWQHVPYSFVQSDAILGEHTLPLWDRYVSCGTTLLGQGQSMWGDPVHLLVVLAGGASWAWDLKFVLAKVLFAAGLALAVRTLTRDTFAGLLVAAAAPFVAFFNFRFNHPAIFSVGYSSWILCGWAMLTRADSSRAFRRGLLVWGIANLIELGSGTVKEAYVLILVLNLTGGLIWASAPHQPMSARIRHGGAILLTGLCCIAISMPLWVTFFDSLQTATTSYVKPLVWQAPRAWVIGLFDSVFYTQLNPGHIGFLPAANLLISLGAGFAVFRSPRRLVADRPAFVLLVAVIGALLMAHEFIPRAWIAAMPLLGNVYHIHNTFSAAAVVLLTLLGGYGFHVARTRLAQPRPWLPILAMGAATTVLLVIYFRDTWPNWMRGPGLRGWLAGAPEHGFFYGNLAASGVAALVLVVLAGRRLHGRTTGRLTAAIALLAIVTLLYRHGLQADLDFAENQLTVPMARARLDAPSPAIEAAQRDAQGAPFRILGTDTTLVAGFNTVYRVEGINGPDAIMNPYYREFAAAAELSHADEWRFPIGAGDLPRLHPYLDFLGVRYVVTASPLPAAAGYAKIGGYDLELQRSETAWPRAFFADAVIPYASVSEFVRQLEAHGHRPFAAVERSATLPAGLTGLSAGEPHIVAAHKYRLGTNSTAFAISAPSRGVAVLQESWLPRDFRVTVNGVPAEPIRVNHTFKGVVLPAAGEYVIEMCYWPHHLTLALWTSVAGLFAFALLFTGLGRTSLGFGHEPAQDAHPEATP